MAEFGSRDVAKIPYIKEVVRLGGVGPRPQAYATCCVSVSELQTDLDVTLCPALSPLFGSDSVDRVRPGVVEMCAGDSVAERALYACLGAMRFGEMCRVEIPTLEPSCHADGCSGRVCCVLELTNVLAPQPVFALSDAEKLGMARDEKQRGVSLAAQGNAIGAAERFQRSLRLLIAMSTEDTEAGSLRCALYNNLSWHQLRAGRHAYAAELADRALAREPRNAKALWRRAQAASALGELPVARDFVVRLIVVEPGNAAASARLREIDAKERAAEGSQAAMARAMLGL